MKPHLLHLILTSLAFGIGLAGLTTGYAADPASSDKADTLIYRAKIPDQPWDGWDFPPPSTSPETTPIPPPEQFELVERSGQSPRLFSGKVIFDGPMDGVEVGLVSLVDIPWNHPDAYQWEPVRPDGSFSITDKHYLDADKALAMRGPHTTWTFLRFNFNSHHSAKNIVLKAGPSKKVRLTASGADMVDLAQVRYEPFQAHFQQDDHGNFLCRQRFDPLPSGDEKFVNAILPAGEIALFVHCAGFADDYQIVDTTKADKIHFVLMKAGRMRVTVLDAAGKPKSGVRMHWLNQAAPLSLAGARTNEDGVAFPDRLVPGTFELNVDGFAERKVEVREGEVTEVVFQDGKTS